MPDHRKRMRTLAIGWLCILLSACNSTVPAASVTTVPQISDSVTDTSLPPTMTMAKATVTPTRTITPTRRPTSTPTFEPPAATATTDPGEQLTAQALEVQQTKIAEFPVNCNISSVPSLSPNGIWVASKCEDEEGLRSLEIVNREGKRWTLNFKDYYVPWEGEPAEQGMVPYGSGLYPHHWTSDDQYLYFGSYVNFEGGGICFDDGTGPQALYRIDLNSGWVSSVIRPTTGALGYELEFSPGGGKIAYVQAYSRDRLTILDLRMNEIDQVTSGGEEIAYLRWSPDGTQLAFASCRITGEGTDDYPSIEGSSMNIYSLKTHRITSVLQVEQAAFAIESRWDSPELLISTFDDNRNHIYSHYDWDSGVLIEETPTPGPEGTAQEEEAVDDFGKPIQ